MATGRALRQQPDQYRQHHKGMHNQCQQHREEEPGQRFDGIVTGQRDRAGNQRVHPERREADDKQGDGFHGVVEPDHHVLQGLCRGAFLFAQEHAEQHGKDDQPKQLAFGAGLNNIRRKNLQDDTGEIAGAAFRHAGHYLAGFSRQAEPLTDRLVISDAGL